MSKLVLAATLTAVVVASSSAATLSSQQLDKGAIATETDDAVITNNNVAEDDEQFSYIARIIKKTRNNAPSRSSFGTSKPSEEDEEEASPFVQLDEQEDDEQLVVNLKNAKKAKIIRIGTTPSPISTNGAKIIRLSEGDEEDAEQARSHSKSQHTNSWRPWEEEGEDVEQKLGWFRNGKRAEIKGRSGSKFNNTAIVLSNEDDADVEQWSLFKKVFKPVKRDTAAASGSKFKTNSPVKGNGVVLANEGEQGLSTPLDKFKPKKPLEPNPILPRNPNFTPK